VKRDPLDRHAPERNAVSFLASLLVHALIAFFLFSVASSSSEQSPESFSGGMIVTISSRPVASSAPAPPATAAPPVPHAQVVPSPRVVAARPRSAPPHPPVRHELAKFAPTAPPNPTPAPVSSSAPNPIPTQAVIAVSPAPLPEQVPTAAPATTVAVSVKVPPSAEPSPKPSVAPTQAPQTPRPQPTAAPTAPPATPVPEPSVIAVTAPPIEALATPVPAATAGAPAQVKIAAAPQQHGAAPSPGPKPAASSGPRGQSQAKSKAPSRPVQVPATPRPAPVTVGGKRHPSLNERLQSLIPTAAPSVSPAPPQHYNLLGKILPTPVPEPTPPPDVIAATKFLFVEGVASQRWKQSWLGTAPEERYVKMYVTSVKRIGFVQWCTGWVLRAPMAGNQKWIIEPNESFICAGHLEPFTPPSPLPSSSP
jgi:hypothetical protein